jgi:hypothetical protein
MCKIIEYTEFVNLKVSNRLKVIILKVQTLLRIIQFINKFKPKTNFSFYFPESGLVFVVCYYTIVAKIQEIVANF